MTQTVPAPNLYGLTWKGFAVLFSTITLFFIIWPDFDLIPQRWMWDAGAGQFIWRYAPLFEFTADAIEWVVIAVALVPLPVWIYNRIRKTRVWGITGRVYAYLVLTMAVGPGLLVNEVFKNHWGRARPRQVAEFGGTAHYTPPGIPTDQCLKNCSFTSGDASVAFWFFAVAFLLPQRCRGYGLAFAVLFGLFIGFGRMAQGAHFFSDVLYSGLTVYLSARVIHHLMLRRPIAGPLP